jgi:zinc/manganese transport system substrate-binding protein
LKVITTTSDLHALVAEVGGSDVVAESLCKGTQDPHFLEAKPSFMVKVSAADLVVAVGLGLEVGWLPNIISGSRNPRVAPGQPGYLEAGALVEPLERATGPVARDQGDVHPEGNPHITLDPVRAGKIAVGIAERLSTLDPLRAAVYRERAHKLNERLATKSLDWQKRLKATGVTKVVTYHKTFNYFLDRYGIAPAAYLEPLPGIPPTAKHIVGVIKTVKDDRIGLIMVESYFDPNVARRIQHDVKSVRIVSVPVAVGADEDVATLDGLYERLVTTIEGTTR